MPADANANGDIFGGWICRRWTSPATFRRCAAPKGRIATVAVNQFIFKQPVQIGDVVSFYASVKRVGRTSVTVDVEVFSERNRGTTVVKVTEAELTYVRHRCRPQTTRAAAGWRNRAGVALLIVADCDTGRRASQHPPAQPPQTGLRPSLRIVLFNRRFACSFSSCIAGAAGEVQRCWAQRSASAPCATNPAALAPSLAVGDIVFTRIPFALFTKITEVTGGWANHVGVVTCRATNR